MSDINAVAAPIAVTAQPVLDAMLVWLMANRESVGVLAAALVAALVDGLSKSGPLTKQPWLANGLKMLAVPIGRAVTDWIGKRRK